MNTSRWIRGRLAARRQWTGNLFSLLVEAGPIAFEAGQFVKIGLAGIEGLALPAGDEGILGRPYSFVNPPQDPLLEFLCVEVPGGPLSPRLARLQPGDEIHVARQPAGFLVLSEIPDADTLWMISTGTGVGPFLSILRTEAPWRRFRQIVLVQGTRQLAERSHRELIDAIRLEHPQQFRMVSLVTRDVLSPAEGGEALLQGRIPAALADGRLEAAAAAKLDPESAHVMLCGNPAMIDEVTELLKARGMRRHRRRTPGHITVENYW